jgi:hypothetical protein
MSDRDNITEADRNVLMATVCPDCGGAKFRGDALCPWCEHQRAEMVEPPAWLGWFMLAVILMLCGALALVVNAQIVKARNVQAEQSK